VCTWKSEEKEGWVPAGDVPILDQESLTEMFDQQAGEEAEKRETEPRKSKRRKGRRKEEEPVVCEEIQSMQPLHTPNPFGLGRRG
jgi:hypothetical protein